MRGSKIAMLIDAGTAVKILRTQAMCAAVQTFRIRSPKLRVLNGLFDPINDDGHDEVASARMIRGVAVHVTAAARRGAARNPTNTSTNNKRR